MSVSRIAIAIGRKEGRKGGREGKEGDREVKEIVMGMHSVLLKNTSRSMHEKLSACCVNISHKPYSILSKICHGKWDFYPIK